MKRKCTYILIGLLCFLGFSGEVNAEDDYKEICHYRYQGTRNSNTDDRQVYTLTLLHNQKYPGYNQHYEFKIRVEDYKEKLDYDSGEDNYSKYYDYYFYLDPFKEGKGYNGRIVGADGKPYVYAEKELNVNQCPKNFVMNPNNFSYCYFSNDTEKEYCQRKITFNSVNPVLTQKVIEKGTYNNIKDGSVCSSETALEDDFCYVSFTYKNNDLLIQYGNSKEDAYNTANGTSFDCYKGNSIKYGGVYSGTVYLINSNADLHSDKVIISSRAEFDKKYLEEWNENGTCPEISIDPVGDNHDYWILFSDAVTDVETYGSSKIDANNFIGLKDMDYDWKNWFDLRNEYDNCEGLLGENLIATINDVLLYVKILIPVALIAFGLIDFVKAVFSTKEDDMKKAQVRFIKRLIMAVIVFIVPSIINLLMTAVDGIWAHINNSACNIWK